MTTLTAICLTHRRVPLQLLEQFPRGASAEAVLQAIRRMPPVSGCLVLSTCNRFEVYVTSKTSIPVAEVIRAVADSVAVDPTDWTPLAECFTDQDAVRHLFCVAAGLDSRLLGEKEILGQVRASAQASARAGCLDIDLATLTQRAVRASRRARRSLPQVGPRSSVADLGVDVLSKLLGGLAGRRVLVLGAGVVGERASRTLTSAGAATVVCARDVNKVQAAVPDASVVPIELLPAVLGTADAVICATSAPSPLITASVLGAAVAELDRRPLLIIDLAVPRNVDQDAAQLANLIYLDLDALALCDNALDDVGHSATAAREVVDKEVAAYENARAERDVAGLLHRVTTQGEQIRTAELLRASGRLSEEELAVVDELSRRVLAKVLHPVLTGVRAAAASGNLDAARTAARLFCGDGVEPPVVADEQQAS